MAWFEVHTENYLGGGKAPAILDAVRNDYPLSLHGVGLSLGSVDGIDEAHLERVALAVARFEPGLVSEHLSWNIVYGTYLADLLPLPLTEEALAVVCRNVDRGQSRLRRKFLVENPSSYLRFTHSSIPEWEFLAAVAARTGCGILCDVNNVYVSAWNHGWDALAYLKAIPASLVGKSISPAMRNAGSMTGASCASTTTARVSLGKSGRSSPPRWSASARYRH